MGIPWAGGHLGWKIIGCRKTFPANLLHRPAGWGNGRSAYVAGIAGNDRRQFFGGSPACPERPAGIILERTLFHCLAADALGMAKILQCDPPAAIRAFEHTAEISARAGFAMYEIMALSHLAGLHLQQGQLHSAAFGYQRALELAIHAMGKCSPVTGNILLGLGELPVNGTTWMVRSVIFSSLVELFTQFSSIGVPIAYLSIARVKAAQGDWDSGQEYLEKARQFAQTLKATRLDDRLGEWIASPVLGWARGNCPG